MRSSNVRPGLSSRIVLAFIVTVLAAGGASAAGAAAPPPPLAAAPRYLVVDLGSGLGGKLGSAASSIDDVGLVAGSAFLGASSVQHAVLWTFGVARDLGSLGGPGTSSSVVFPGLNDRGEVVGITEIATPDPLGEPWSCSAFISRAPGTSCVGFVWRHGVMTALPTLGGANGFAAGVNNRGQVVGWAETAAHDPTCDPTVPQVRQFRAVIWGPDGRAVELPAFHGEPDQAAVAVNDRGQVAGISGICGQAVGALSARHAVLWDGGTVTDLGNLGGAGWNTPLAINDEGVIVGFTNLSPDLDGFQWHAFIWSRALGREQDLGVLLGDYISEATSINDRGQIVGVSFGKGFAHPRAVVWENGVPVDMNSLPLAGAPLTLTAANAIDQEGAIAGTATDQAGNPVSFVAIPLP